MEVPETRSRESMNSSLIFYKDAMPKLTYEQRKLLAGSSPGDGKLMIYKKGKHLKHTVGKTCPDRSSCTQVPPKESQTLLGNPFHHSVRRGS